jgi:L,D-peptidoglycan transpeptidase YkuD (ErfK/YbiS/YcfS/YnhG family)
MTIWGRRRRFGWLIALLVTGCDGSETTSEPNITSEAEDNTTLDHVATTIGPAGTPTINPATGTEPKPDQDCPQGYTYRTQEVGRSPADKLLIEKSRHRLHIVRNQTIVKSFTVALGSGGLEQKIFEGDRKTPEGRFAITGRYPSKWHTYLALDYPGDTDRARYDAAVQRGDAPPKVGAGSAIAIHGHRADQPSRLHKLVDWTLGCIALDNNEIDEIAAVAPKGTVVEIIR